MSNVFPLPLAPFEEYMLLDDRPDYRMEFLVEQSFEGEIDRKAFEAGIVEASRRHPLLSSHVQRRFLFGQRWISANGQLPVVDWGDIDQPIAFPAKAGIDLSREVGVRFFARVGGGRSRLVTQFHHACCDGLGAIQFLSDLFASYTRTLFPNAEKHPAYQPVDTSHLRRRAALRVHTDRTMPWVRLFAITLGYVWKYVVHPAMPIARPMLQKANSEPLSYPGMLTRTFPPSVQRRLRQIARKHDVTVNELLLRELMLVLEEWNRRHVKVRDWNSISILIPTNLRNLDHDQMPATNIVSYVAFQRKIRELRDPARLLKSLKQESQFYKRWRFGAAFLDSLKVMRWMPGLLRLVLAYPRSLSTAIFSCIGDPSLAILANFPVNAEGNPIMGNLVFDDLNTAPPIRPRTHASFTTWHFSNKLRLGVRCDSSVFDEASAQELLNLFADRVEALTQDEQSGDVRRAA